MIINTAEMLTPENYVYVEGMDIANYVQQYSDRETVSWKGETFRYYQCPQTMPSDDGILELVSLVQTIKPASIVLVGGTSLVAGVVKDILSVIEHFDLYVNPIRRGGGTSVIEAMYKKIPAVTVDYGDVGDQFCCKNYDEMVPIIKEYITNKKFYEAQAKLAGELADEYLDSFKEFARIMKEYYKLQGME